MKNTKELLGARIKELRKGRKLSQEELAELIGIEPRHMSRIEVGKSYPSLDRLERIAMALNVDLRDFFDFAHLEARPVNVDQINDILKEMTDEDLKKATRILKVFRR
uniref:Transcriptional regulator, XRE family n=1 Tax=Geobacter sp. (strain M21) TaxID=443144 RepID=C6E135_GEOSM